MTRPRFDHSISLGSIITLIPLLGLAGSMIVAWTSLTSRVATVEVRVAALAIGQDAIETRAREADAELRTGVRRIDDKLTALLIQGYRASAPTPTPPAIINNAPRD